MIRSIKTLSYRGDICFLPAAASLNSCSRILEHDRFFHMLWHVPFVWIPYPGLPSESSLSFPVLPISQLLHVETVCHTACGREADTCCLLHVRSHVEGYLPALEASASGKLQQSRSDSPDIGALYDCNDTS